MEIFIFQSRCGPLVRWIHLIVTLFIFNDSIGIVFAGKEGANLRLGSLDPDLELPAPLFKELFGGVSNIPLVLARTNLTIYCGVELQDVRGIDAAKGTFNARGFLWYYWDDSRFAYSNGPGESLKWNADSIREQLWIPQLDFDNSVGEVKRWDGTIEVFPEGRVEYWFYFAGEFADQDGLMDFTRFPCEELPLAIDVNTSYTASKVQLAYCRESSPGDITSTLSRRRHPEFRFVTPRVEVRDQTYSSEWDRHFSTLRVVATARRNKGYYLLHIIFPVVVILFVFICGQRIAPRQFEAKISLSLTCLLSLIAYTFTFSDQLPKVGYVTLLDLFITGNYVIIAIGTASLCVGEWCAAPSARIASLATLTQKHIHTAAVAFVCGCLLIFAIL
jgi:hypothetical protein